MLARLASDWAHSSFLQSHACSDRFTLEVETSMPLDEDEVIEMLVDEEGHKPEFASSRPRRGVCVCSLGRWVGVCARGCVCVCVRTMRSRVRMLLGSFLIEWIVVCRNCT